MSHDHWHGGAADSGALASRYPASDESFYVLACVAMNGQNTEGLQKCSCAINAIEAELPYEQYSARLSSLPCDKLAGKVPRSTGIPSP
jgi:hypothetical protein